MSRKLKKEYRNLLNYFAKERYHCFSSSIKELEEKIKEMKKYPWCKNSYYIKQEKLYRSHIRILQIGEKLEYPKAKIYKNMNESCKNKIKLSSEYKKKPQSETRDNKDIHVGGGGSNQKKVRYPSKKRSLYTWKKFYKLFPILAERDNFNGKTSDKMK
jgi:hypothetical protein